ncbi:MAG TPA: hypothetical protein VMR14_04980 [Streptosporangiaceae bacterium]|nr:hypothetical protein [Streptosporangiaceae bacterium]
MSLNTEPDGLRGSAAQDDPPDSLASPDPATAAAADESWRDALPASQSELSGSDRDELEPSGSAPKDSPPHADPDGLLGACRPEVLGEDRYSAPPRPSA